MSKKQIYYIIEWSVAIAACGWLVWKMATYDDYAGLWAAIRGMDWMEWGALMIAVALMPVNMALEAWRWKTLMDEGVNGLMDEGISWREAHRQVYYSKLAGLITPWRLGEYPSRALLMAREVESGKWKVESIWARVLSMGAVGSATMTMAIVIAGVASLGVLGTRGGLGNLGDIVNREWWIAVAAVVVLLMITVIVVPRWLMRGARSLSSENGTKIEWRLVIKSVGQSLVRLACWCVQLGLVLFALDGLGSLGVLGILGECAVYYLLVTITPNVPIAEVGVRGAWAIVVFGTMNAALAGVLLWGINTLMPCLIWPFLRGKKAETSARPN